MTRANTTPHAYVLRYRNGYNEPCAVVYALTAKAARQQLEALMLTQYEYQSDFARRYFSAGRQEGRQEGRQDLIGRLLRRRFGPAAEGLVARLGSLDPEALDWVGDALLDAPDLVALETGLARRHSRLS